MSQLK